MSRACTKIQNWVLLHPGEMPVFVKKHTAKCPACTAFIQEEAWLQKQLNSLKAVTPEISLAHSLRVKQAIWETSQILSQKKKQSYLFPKVASALTVFSLIFIFLFAPINRGENFFGVQVNRKLASYINHNETLTLASVEAVDIASSLKFVSQYVNTTEEKTFYYSTNSLSREEYLLISFLSKKTKVSVEQIYEWITKGGYAFTFRKLNLPFQKTVSDIQNYIDQFRVTSQTQTFSLDGYVTWVDYAHDSIGIDNYSQEVILDAAMMHLVHIGLYAKFTLKEKDGLTTCIKMNDTLFPSVVISGKVVFQDEQGIRLEGNPAQIRFTSKTIFNSPKNSKQKNSFQDIIVRIRAMLVKDQMTAITISPLGSGIERTMTGSLDQVYEYGFTMQNLKISYCFESSPKISLTRLPVKTLVTVSGKDFGTYFVVSSFSVISTPKKELPGHSYYLAKADSQEPRSMARQTSVGSSYDFVVAVDEKNLYLASGRIISTKLGTFPVGSKIKLTTKDTSKNFILSLEEIGTFSIYRGNIVLMEKISNGSFLYTSEQKDKQIYLYPKKGINLPLTGTLQGVMIQYDNLAIMVDYRLFQIKQLQTTKGLVTTYLEETKMVVLDNGIMVKIDDWAQINGANLGVGKTLQLFGVFEQGVFKAYMVTIEKELVMFKGVIVEINTKKQTIKLDSGQIIEYNTQTNFLLQKKQLEVGDLIYVKAYLNDIHWIASNIWTPREGLDELGETL